jgi:aryl-alcohol dehydrogenase-like predicted oxidoreductase
MPTVRGGNIVYGPDATEAEPIALAWLIAPGPNVVPIPGVKRRAIMEDSVKAGDLELSQADLATLNAAILPDATLGPRYRSQSMRMVDG